MMATEQILCAGLSRGFASDRPVGGHADMISKSEAEHLVVDDALEVAVEIE